MSSPQSYPHEIFESKLSSRSSLHDLNEEIMEKWETRVRGELNAAGSLLQPALRNALPRFLELLGEALAETKPRGMLAEAEVLMKKHAEGRARDTLYSPAQIVQELQVLREEVAAALETKLRLSSKDYETIQKTFEQAMQEALLCYFRMHASIRDQFMNTLSHDLRGPLAAARMGTELSRKIAEGLYDRERGGELEKALERVARSLQRVDRMIQELLDASAMEIGEKIQLQIGPCEMLSLAKDAVEELGEPAKARVQLMGAEVHGYWDGDGLRRSVENLVSNALKYGGEGTPILVNVLRDGDRVRVAVHNEGNPISEADQRMLFQAFHRGKCAVESGHKGWGIGLALARSVTESLGGGLTMKSSALEGTTFTIDLPLDSRAEKAA